MSGTPHSIELDVCDCGSFSIMQTLDGMVLLAAALCDPRIDEPIVLYAA